jgi:hypothetical protein
MIPGFSKMKKSVGKIKIAHEFLSTTILLDRNVGWALPTTFFSPPLPGRNPQELLPSKKSIPHIEVSLKYYVDHVCRLTTRPQKR